MSDMFWEIVHSLSETHPNNSVVSALFRYDVNRDKIDYIDIMEDKGEMMMSFLPTNRKDSELGVENPYESTLRQAGRLGKVIQKIFNEPCPDKDVKEFVESVYLFCKENKYELNEVTGKDLPFFFLQENCVKSANSELAKSCMRYEKCSKWFGIYENNPNLSMIAVTRGEKVVARALLWKEIYQHKLGKRHEFTQIPVGVEIPKTGLRVLDRIYGANSRAKAQIQAWAKENTDLMLQRPKHSTSFIVSKSGKNVILPLAQAYDDYKYYAYPYIDTFRYYDVNKKEFNNHGYEMKDAILFDSTEGGFSIWGGYPPTLAAIRQELDINKVKSTVAVTTSATF
jgi:hypothetical protein